MESKETSYINACLDFLKRNPSTNTAEKMIEWLKMYLSSSYRDDQGNYFHYDPEKHGKIVSYGIKKTGYKSLGKNTSLVLYLRTSDSGETMYISLRKFKQYCRKNRLYTKDVLNIELSPVELVKIDRFIEKHKNCNFTSTIGGKISYTVTHTGIGPFVDIKCNVCGATECITDISKF